MTLADYDVIVVGAGPGGSACARLLGEKGVRVLLLDKASFPRDKPCGDAISGKSIQVLQKLGVLEKMNAKPHSKIKGVTLTSPDATELTLRLPAGKEHEHGFVLRREHFDNILFEHATKVCEFRHRVQVVGMRKENGQMKVKYADLSTKETKEVSCYIVVGADGAVSTIARELNAHELPPQHGCVAVRQYVENVQGLTDNVEIHFFEDVVPGYFWIFPLENGNANIGAGMILQDLHQKHVHLPEVLEKITLHPRFVERFAGSKPLSPVLGWTLPFGSHERKMAFDHAVLIGDAAALVDPFTGEGIGNALVSAQLASETIEQAIQKKDYSEAFLLAYQQNVRDTLGPELKTSHRLQRMIRFKPLLNWSLAKAKKNPRVAEYLSSALLEQAPRAELGNPIKLIQLLLG